MTEFHADGIVPADTEAVLEVLTVRWHHWDRPDEVHEEVTLRWENNGWTIQGSMPAEQIHYALRLDADGTTRQFLLFRDLDEPDLWLAHDGRGHWGEVNGAHRGDLDGCADVGPVGSVLLRSLPIRRLGVWAGATKAFEIDLAHVDTGTLAVVPSTHRYARLGTSTWTVTQPAMGAGAMTEPVADEVEVADDVEMDVAMDIEVDEDWLVIDLAGTARRDPTR